MRSTTTTRRSLPVLPQTRNHRPPGPVAPAGVRIGLVTLGCDKNTVDSERLAARLAGGGAAVGAVDSATDVVVINTCGFIEAAREESIDAILDAVRMKQSGAVRAVVAVGCLVQRYREELAKEIPEVDLFLGLTEAERLVPELRRRGLLPDPATLPTMERPLRLLSTSTPHTSYLKISEGCDHGCAFCAIPLMRGKHRSAPLERLVAEARELEAGGVVELNIISQDTTWYGRDLVRAARTGTAVAGDASLFIGREFVGMAGPHAGAAPTSAITRASASDGAAAPLLPDLLRALLRETGVPWFRLFYMYPSGITRGLVALMADEPRLLPYLDMPLQHGSDAVLERMRRPERRATIRERVRWLRDAIPDLVLRTTVIVGFPGETDAEFEQLLELLEEIRFDRVGAFAYSNEENTRAASLPDPVPGAVTRERLERLDDLQRTITLENNEALVGREVDVLIDSVRGGGAVARTRGQALEVDGVVHLSANADAAAGEFRRAIVTGADEHDLTAVLAEGDR